MAFKVVDEDAEVTNVEGPGEATGWPSGLRILPPDWPAGHAHARPGDLRRFATHRFRGVAPDPPGPLARPLCDLRAVDAHPILAAADHSAAGGCIYFGYGADENALRAVADLMDAGRGDAFAAFAASSRDPRADGFVDQLRLVFPNALKRRFHVELAEPPPRQPLSAAETVVAFIQAQTARWTDERFECPGLAGLLGGDGDGAREQLAFGLCVEDPYWGIVRVWSRIWLMTK